MKNHFDEAAKTWDMKPERIERAQKFADEIVQLTANKNLRSAMEFGAGTGAVSFCLKDHFPEIIMLDESAGMIDEIRKKIQSFAVTHMRARQINLLAENYTEKHDVIYTLLVLHHIQDVSAILKIFHTTLNPGGLLILADLVTEDGSFHAEHPDFTGHRGFDVAALERMMSDTGFRNIHSKIFYHSKKIINGAEKTFPVFLLSGEKIASRF